MYYSEDFPLSKRVISFMSHNFQNTFSFKVKLKLAINEIFRYAFFKIKANKIS